VKGGDIVVEFAGQKLPNIYDYSYTVYAVKIGPRSAEAEKVGAV
jgi:hypothetical protein